MRGVVRVFLAAAAAAMLVNGCNLAVSSEGAGTPAPRAAGGLKQVKIYDPNFGNSEAATLTIPAGWKMDGIMVKSPCNPAPWPAFRAYSPDGLSEMRYQPVFGWQWRPKLQRFMQNTGCLPLDEKMSAAKFLQYYIGMLKGGVHIVGPAAVSAQYQQWADGYVNKLNQLGANGMAEYRTDNSDDTAALRIEIINGSFVIEQRLRTAVECSLSNHGNMQDGGVCFARVDILSAPKGRLDALIQLVDGNNLPRGVGNPAYFQAVMQHQNQEASEALRQLNEQAARNNAMLHQQFESSMQMMRANHAAFMQQQESQFHSAMNSAINDMNARSTAASDWVDYALDQQTVTGSGGTVKVSSAYSQTWSNGQNEWYQTNDANANPNGVLPGNWTHNVKVHGNGQPY